MMFDYWAIDQSRICTRHRHEQIRGRHGKDQLPHMGLRQSQQGKVKFVRCFWYEIRMIVEASAK